MEQTRVVLLKDELLVAQENIQIVGFVGGTIGVFTGPIDTLFVYAAQWYGTTQTGDPVALAKALGIAEQKLADDTKEYGLLSEMLQRLNVALQILRRQDDAPYTAASTAWARHRRVRASGALRGSHP